MAKTSVSVVSVVFLTTAICACGDGTGAGSDGGGGAGDSGRGGSSGNGGGSGGSAGSCNMNPTCGGVLDGTWQMDTTCVEGNVAQMMADQLSLPAACNGLFQTATLSLKGTAKFANGMETDNLTMTTDARVLYTPACVSAINGTTVTLTAAICTTMQSSLLSSGTFSSASCAFTGGNCACSVSNQQQSPGTPVAYTVSGSQVSYTDGSSPMDYCVQGTTLTARQLDSGLTLFNTAHKL